MLNIIHAGAREGDYSKRRETLPPLSMVSSYKDIISDIQIILLFVFEKFQDFGF